MIAGHLAMVHSISIRILLVPFECHHCGSKQTEPIHAVIERFYALVLYYMWILYAYHRAHHRGVQILGLHMVSSPNVMCPLNDIILRTVLSLSLSLSFDISFKPNWLTFETCSMWCEQTIQPCLSLSPFSC